MASIYRRGETWWLKYSAGARTVRTSLKTSNRKVAQAKLKEIEYLRTANRLRAPSKTSTSQLLSAYFDHLAAVRKKKSAQTDIGRVRIFFEACPVSHLEDLHAGMVQAYLDQRVRQGELSPKTANEYRVSLHSLVEFAVKYLGFISSDPQFPNPIKRVKRYQISAEEITFLTLPQIDAQLKALEPWPQMRAVAATCIYAGLRRAEALWLTVDDVQLRHTPPLLQIRAKEIDGVFWEPKTKTNRVVPISSALHPMLAEYSLARPKGSVWFFPSPHGCRWNEDNFTQAFAHVRRPTGLLWTLLDFRHTFGSQLAQKGESLYKISKLMGNSPEICRKHYAALVPEEMAEAVEFREANIVVSRRPENGASTLALEAAAR